MIAALLVGLGGFLGAVLRFGVGQLVVRAAPGALFPWGTLVVNALGCFVLGLVQGVGSARGGLAVEQRAFVVVGLLGGFTTFSTFGFETFELATHLELGRATLNVLAQVGLGLLAAAAGFWLGRLPG